MAKQSNDPIKTNKMYIEQFRFYFGGQWQQLCCLSSPIYLVLWRENEERNQRFHRVTEMDHSISITFPHF